MSACRQYLLYCHRLRFQLSVCCPDHAAASTMTMTSRQRRPTWSSEWELRGMVMMGASIAKSSRSTVPMLHGDAGGVSQTPLGMTVFRLQTQQMEHHREPRKHDQERTKEPPQNVGSLALGEHLLFRACASMEATARPACCMEAGGAWLFASGRNANVTAMYPSSSCGRAHATFTF